MHSFYHTLENSCMFWLYICSHLQAGCKILNKKTISTIWYNSGDKISSLHPCTFIQKYIKVHENIWRLQKDYIKCYIIFIKAQRLSQFGHVQRMSDTRTFKKIFKWKPLTKSSQGRPKYRWEDNTKQDICQMKIKNWIACVQIRGKWKEVVEKGKICNH